MRISMIQMSVTGDRRGDIARAEALIARAAAQGTDLAVLPEMFCCPYDTARFAAYGEPEGGEAWTALSRAARAHGVWLVGGSVPELDGGRVYNTSYVFDRAGRQAAKHRKAHLFDIDVPGGQFFRESDVLSPGDRCTVFETEFGPVGLCVCFDFRSQELAKAMADRGAKLLVVPGAFNLTTGPAHWELLFRSRAVDNQVFTLGVAPARDEAASYVSWAHSICVDPWGTVLADLGTGEAAETLELDLARVDEVRRQLPIRASRRPELYGYGA